MTRLYMNETTISYRIIGYPRSIIATLLSYIATFLYCGVCVIGALFLGGNQQFFTFMIRAWSRSVCWLNSIQVEIEGLENIPKSGAIYCFNHSSHFDIPTIYSELPFLRFGAKAELFSIPVFGSCLKAIGTLPIVRGNIEKVLRLYDESIARVQKGESFVLAPEGTRQPGPELGTFKGGPFIFAINAQAPIVPLVLEGVNEILPKAAFIPNWGKISQPVRIKILPQIDTKGFTLEDRPALQEKARRAMRQAHSLITN